MWRSATSDHDKGVSIVDMDASGNCEIRHVPLTPRRDVRIVEGFLDDLLAAGVEDPARDDYLLVRLSDAHALLDVMGKLRTVYPNVLHLERPGLIREGDAQARADRMRKGELAMFEDFWAAVGPGPLSDDAQSYVSTMIDQIHRGEAG
jgi:exonuclease SbcD